jgi:hypothetical protein
MEMSWTELRIKIRTPVGLLLVLLFLGQFILDRFEEGRMLLENLPYLLRFLTQPVPSLLILVMGMALILWEIYDIRKTHGEPAKLQLRHYVVNSLIGFLGLLLIVGAVAVLWMGYRWIEKPNTAKTQPAPQSPRAPTTSANKPSGSMSPTPAPRPSKATTPPRRPKPSAVEDSQVNSFVESSGTMEGLTIKGGSVTSPSKGRATTVKQLPGSVMKDVKIEDATVSSDLSATKPSGEAFLKEKNSVGYGTTSNNVACGYSTLLKAEGKSTDESLVGNNVNNSRLCDWNDFLLTIADQREDIADFMSKWRKVQADNWKSKSEELQNSYGQEFEALTQTLVTASEDQDKFQKAIMYMRIKAPTFDIKRP